MGIPRDEILSSRVNICEIAAPAGYTPQDFVELVKKHKIAFYEKKLGQLFCRESSRQIVEMLLSECRRARVEIKTSCTVTEARRTNVFEVETSQGLLKAEKLIVACGGLSFPKIGASDLGYRIARQFGLKIIEQQHIGAALEAKLFDQFRKRTIVRI